MPNQIAAIDRKINFVRKQLRTPEKIDMYSAASWQDAWDKHPDLHAREKELFSQRGAAQLERDKKAYDAAMRVARSERRVARNYRAPVANRCTACGHPMPNLGEGACITQAPSVGHKGQRKSSLGVNRISGLASKPRLKEIPPK